MKPIILTALFLFAAIQVQASPKLDLGVLRDAICQWETRGERHPDHYVGDAGEVGYCAVRMQTAEFLGFKGDGLDLMNRSTNMRYALKWLKYCYRKGRRTVPLLAACYNGPLATAGYIRQIRSDYAELYKRRHGPGIRLARR